jgi:hypothetical protein
MIAAVIYILAFLAFVFLGIEMALTISDMKKRHISDNAGKKI